MSNIPTLQATGISKSFVSGSISQQVIKQSSLDVFSGELTLLVGPSGSGKSTMLSMLSGLLHPDTGMVMALGTNLWSLGEKELDAFRLEHCGFIFQGFNLFGSLSALDNVILPLQYMGIQGEEARDRARLALEEVGLGGRSHLRPLELSGGEKQRVAIARALVKRPQMIFADEPTSALDKANSEIVITLLQSIAGQHNATVLGVTHDPRLLSHADRVIHLEDGILKQDHRNP
ncbi:ABC transporter ATP-binding protein [Desulfovibrio desulfuricans]|uniref:ABC transporter ATP-binding protein n=1 Tax=Desulfovibrio desulfuricans TaxID=876 RepID=UPI0003B6E8FF|nr:ABC transporter ATP-binding protein [Desulfovibrio desulfuricans]MDD3682597.1 ABC transporter ATP-binding protein [Desulfovibrio desulfuricans]QTO40447.1 ABC transporter ATP-binding protein [Desulfovibrio desulfuricans]